MTHAWVNPAAGVAGDMLLAALVDAGADRLAIMDAWAALDLSGYAATWEVVDRCGMRALWTNLVIHNTDDDHDHKHDTHDPSNHPHGPHRPAREVIALIEAAELPAGVKQRSVAVYRAIAEAEAQVHQLDPDDVELHEVGALDSILDIVGVCAGLDNLGVTNLGYGPIGVGHGTISTAHGNYPNPVPAVTELVTSAGSRLVAVDTTMELATPTGVALLTTLGMPRATLPPIDVAATGTGAGTANPAGRANVVHVLIGTPTTDTDDALTSLDGLDGLIELATNVDDLSGEIIAHTIARLLDVGALDAWATPIVMKKGRPAHTIGALCRPNMFDIVRTTLVDECGTFGVRWHRVTRHPEPRHDMTVTVDGHPVRVKCGPHRIKAEHDDALAAARASGRPLRDVLAAAEADARRQRDTA